MRGARCREDSAEGCVRKEGTYLEVQTGGCLEKRRGRDDED